jgi:mannose-6-phosphate isomerase-like protein (cupin superfamily)
MSAEHSTVKNWRDVQPRKVAPGIEEYVLILPQETPAKRVGASLLVIQPDAVYKPEKFAGERFHYFLTGNGILLWHRDNTDLPYLIDNDTAGWIPGTHTYQFENTGEGPMRCFSVSCITNESYAMRDGRLGKLNGLTAVTRKVADTSYSSGVTGAKKITGGGYQVFAPGKAQGEHWHDEEVIYLVRGEGKLMSAGKEHQLKAGSAGHNPHNIKHRMTNTGRDMFGYLVLEFRP